MAAVQPVSSIRNPLLCEVRKAVAKGAVTESGCVVAETFHLLEEALRSDCSVEHVLAAHSVRSAVEGRIQRLAKVRMLVLPDSLFGEVAATETSQGVVALVKPPQWSLEHLFRGRSLVLVLDGLQDPGNAGAILRSAEALGATGVIFLKGSVNPYNPKAVRASAGSIFRMPLACGLEPELVLASLSQRRIDVYAAMPGTGAAATGVNLKRRCAFVIGGEGHGVGKTMREASKAITIPVAKVESLNAAVAASLLLYECHRQRMLLE
jgi:TrmH family RNA methyltransferase